MASTSETGHPQNVANFEKLITICTDYGIEYNPSKANIKLAALNTKFTDSKTVMGTLKTKKTSFDNSSNTLESACDPIKPLATRIVNSLEATDAKDQNVDDAKTVNRKIQGKRAGKKEPPVNPDVPSESTQISVSQQSYVSIIDNFDKLIKIVAAEPLYIPNENDLKVTALNTTLTSLNTIKSNYLSTEDIYQNAKIARDTTLYSPGTGLVDIAKEVKKYVKSVYGAASPKFKKLNAIPFKTIKS